MTEGRGRWILAGLAAVLLALIGLVPDLPARLRASLSDSAEAAADCSIAEGPCTARFQDGLELVLAGRPEGLPTGAPFELSLSASQAGVLPSHVEIQGLSMNMGLTRVELHPEDAGWVGRGSLPICTLSRMDWRADVLLEQGGQQRVASFFFTSTGQEDAGPPLELPTGASYGDFTVDSAEGPLALSDLRGQLVLVYFGYTACPDVCPTTLSTLSRGLGLLSEDEQEQVAGLFVSVDPERDAPDRLAEYAAFFHPSIRAGTRELEAITAIAADWGVAFRKVQAPGSAMAYTVDHSTSSFLVGREGELLETIPHGSSAERVAELLRSAM